MHPGEARKTRCSEDSRKLFLDDLPRIIVPITYIRAVMRMLAVPSLVLVCLAVQ